MQCKTLKKTVGARTAELVVMGFKKAIPAAAEMEAAAGVAAVGVAEVEVVVVRAAVCPTSPSHRKEESHQKENLPLRGWMLQSRTM